MAKLKVVLHSPAIGAMLRSDDIREGALRGPAERVLAAAEAGAPVATGAYKAGLRMSDATTDRAVIRVGSTVDYADVVEAKTGNLLRALGSA